MESSAVASGSEERKNKDATEESPGEESESGRGSDSVGVACESTRGTNEENGEEEPNPQTGASEGGAEMTEGDAKDNEGEKDGSKDGGEETVKDEKEKECESSENAHREKEKTINKAEEGKAKEAKEDGNNAIAGEEGRGKAKSEEKHEKEEKIVKEEKNNDSEGLAQATADKETKAKEKVEAQTNKEKNRDNKEKTKGKSGAPPSSSSLRTSALASSRPRSARPSARREAMAKFQQDQGPAVRNFKVQKVSAGMSAGASIKQKILHWCSNKTRNYEGVSIENFSSSWSDGLAFCALVHRFFPDAFDFSTLKANEREKNFTLAFSTAESLADCCPLLDVSDMLLMGKNPDPFSVFTYVQSLCQHLSKIERDRKEREKAEEGKNQGEAEAQGEKEAEDKEQEIRAGEEQGEEERETEGDPDEEKGGTEEGGYIKARPFFSNMDTLPTPSIYLSATRDGSPSDLPPTSSSRRTTHYRDKGGLIYGLGVVWTHLRPFLPFFLISCLVVVLVYLLQTIVYGGPFTDPLFFSKFEQRWPPPGQRTPTGHPSHGSFGGKSQNLAT